MCRRYSESENVDVLKERFDLQIAKKYKLNYNASPRRCTTCHYQHRSQALGFHEVVYTAAMVSYQLT